MTVQRASVRYCRIGNSHVTQRLFILWLALVALTGCGRSDTTTDQTIHLRFWNGFAGPDGPAAR